MCLFQFKSDVTVTPIYLADVTLSSAVRISVSGEVLTFSSVELHFSK